MARVRVLDNVAYVRFASIYRRFEETEDFLDAVKHLEAKRDTATFPLPGI
jgi:transcriptional regulator NrdR family protein